MGGEQKRRSTISKCVRIKISYQNIARTLSRSYGSYSKTKYFLSTVVQCGLKPRNSCGLWDMSRLSGCACVICTRGSGSFLLYLWTRLFWVFSFNLSTICLQSVLIMTWFSETFNLFKKAAAHHWWRFINRSSNVENSSHRIKRADPLQGPEHSFLFFFFFFQSRNTSDWSAWIRLCRFSTLCNSDQTIAVKGFNTIEY